MVQWFHYVPELPIAPLERGRRVPLLLFDRADDRALETRPVVGSSRPGGRLDRGLGVRSGAGDESRRFAGATAEEGELTRADAAHPSLLDLRNLVELGYGNGRRGDDHSS